MYLNRDIPTAFVIGHAAAAARRSCVPVAALPVIRIDPRKAAICTLHFSWSWSRRS